MAGERDPNYSLGHDGRFAADDWIGWGEGAIDFGDPVCCGHFDVDPSNLVLTAFQIVMESSLLVFGGICGLGFSLLSQIGS